MLKVRDIMSRAVLTVRADDSTTSAAERLARAGISGAPVRDKHGALVGMLSQADLMNARLAGTRRHPRVSDVMTPDVLGVYADDSALAAALEMARHDIHRLVVWDADGCVAGVVTSLDLVKAIARGAEFDVELPDRETTPERRSVDWEQSPVPGRPFGL
jgi:predicted transcriptional regulator